MTTTKKRGQPAKQPEVKLNAMGRPIKVDPVHEYKLSLKLGKETFSSEGTTMSEALGKLQKPSKLMGKSVLTITVDGSSRELLLQPVRAKRLFYNSAGVQEVLAKQLEFGLIK